MIPAPGQVAPSNELIGRDLEIRFILKNLRRGLLLKVAGPPGVGRSSIIRSALEPLEPVTVRTPVQSHRVPLASAVLWLTALRRTIKGPGKVIDISHAFLSLGAAGLARRLAKALKKLKSRPFCIFDIDCADALSIRALRGALAALGEDAPPIVVSLADDSRVTFGERQTVGPLPALACHELIESKGLSTAQAICLANASRGLPEYLLLGMKCGFPHNAEEILHGVFKNLSSNERIALAAKTWGYDDPRTVKILKKIYAGETSEVTSVLSQAALQSLLPGERSTLQTTMALKCKGVAGAIFRGGTRDRNALKDLHKAGKNLFHFGHAAAAAELFEVAYALDPERMDIQLAFAAAESSMGRWTEARVLVERAIEGNASKKQRAHAYSMKAFLDRQNGDLESAKDALMQADSILPGSFKANMENAILLAETGDASGARLEFRKLAKIASDPLDRIAVNGNLAFLEAREGNTSAARKAFSLAISESEKLGHDENFSTALLNRSFLEIVNGNFRAAARDARASAELARESGLLETELRALENLAEAYLALNMLDESVKAADATIELFTQLRGATDSAIWAFMVKSKAVRLLGDRSEAKRLENDARNLARAVSLESVFTQARKKFAK